jgi:membrane protein implicated in regulation of membrane protease activity
MSVKVRVSPVSRTAAILIIAIGVFVLTAGLVTGGLGSDIAGGAFVALGVILYFLLLRFTKKLEREIAEAQSS